MWTSSFGLRLLPFLLATTEVVSKCERTESGAAYLRKKFHNRQVIDGAPYNLERLVVRKIR